MSVPSSGRTILFLLLLCTIICSICSSFSIPSQPRQRKEREPRRYRDKSLYDEESSSESKISDGSIDSSSRNRKRRRGKPRNGRKNDTWNRSSSRNENTTPNVQSHPTFTKYYVAPALPKIFMSESFTGRSEDVFSPTVIEQNEDECLNYICGDLPITYTNDVSTIRHWLKENIYQDQRIVGTHHSFLGVDVESVPSAKWIKPRNPCMANRPATIQLSSPYAAIVIHLTSPQNSKTIPVLAKVLSDDSILKVGVGIDEDMLEVYRWNHQLDCSARFDIGGIGSATKRSRVSLQKLTKALVGVEIPKSKRLSMSDWSQVPLSEAQLNYCSRDAWAAAAIMENTSKLYRDMHVDLIAQLVKSKERPMLEVDLRAKTRKKAKNDFKAIIEKMKELSVYLTPEEEFNKIKFSRLQLIMPEEVRLELDRLQAIIDDTSPDGLHFFGSEEIGFDFTFD